MPRQYPQDGQFRDMVQHYGGLLKKYGDLLRQNGELLRLVHSDYIKMDGSSGRGRGRGCGDSCHHQPSQSPMLDLITFDTGSDALRAPPPDVAVADVHDPVEQKSIDQDDAPSPVLDAGRPPAASSTTVIDSVMHQQAAGDVLVEAAAAVAAPAPAVARVLTPPPHCRHMWDKARGRLGHTERCGECVSLLPWVHRCRFCGLRLCMKCRYS